MEKRVKINSDQQFAIYGKLIFGSEKKSNENLIIFVHGLTDNEDSYLQVNCSAFFTKYEFDVFRFSFYGTYKKSRRLLQSSISTHVNDLKRILNFFKDKYERIFLIGHSLGGLITLIVNAPFVSAVSLWDPSFDVTFFWTSGRYLTPLPSENAFILDYGVQFLISKKFVDEISYYDNRKCMKIASEFNSPLQLIIPEKSIFFFSPHTSPKQYDSLFQKEYSRVNIVKASHRFTEEGVIEVLLNHSLKWFNQFSFIDTV